MAAKKSPGRYTSSGIRRAGDDYQDAVALDLFVEMLAHPDRWEWVALEADQAGAIDDVVSLRRDGAVVARQVKFTGYSESDDYAVDWPWLLDSSDSKKSLLQKWASSLSLLRKSHDRVEAYLVTNRSPDSGFQNAITTDKKIDLKKVGRDVREQIFQQLDGEENAEAFFATFEFQCDYPDLGVVLDRAQARFFDLHGTDLGWQRLSNQLRGWVRERWQPPPDGRVTLAAIKSACLWQVPEPLPQEFPVPDDFVVPSITFHQEFVDRIGSEDGWFVLAAPPGSGKSTYLSRLVEELADSDLLVIRHHIFLDWDETSSGARREHARIAESLIADLRRRSSQLDSLVPGNPHAGRLPHWLTAASELARGRGGALVLILDGLDHVWRNDKSVDELNRLFDLLPRCEGFRLIVGTQPVADAQLPRRLLHFAPREQWFRLPQWDAGAVRRWIHHHRDELPPDERDNPSVHFMNDLVTAIEERGGGQALYLRYALQTIVESGRSLSAQEFRRLPSCPHGDITSYYSHLWSSLNDEGRRILCLMAACAFPWPRKGIIKALDPSVGTGPAIHAGLRDVLHLTEERDGGLIPVHSSLTVFTRDSTEYLTYAPDLRRSTLTWLRTDAPQFWRWAYEWTLEAELGNSEPLLRNADRKWLVESLATRKPSSIVNNILAEAASIAIDQRALGRFVELGLLADYYNNAIDYTDDVVDEMLYSQLRIEGENLPHQSRRLDAGARSAAVVDLAEFLIEQGEASRGNEAFEILNRRAADEEYEDARRHLGERLATVAAMADVVTASGVAQTVQRRDGNDRYDLLHHYLRGLRSTRRGHKVHEFLNRTRRWPLGIRRCVVHKALPILCEEGMEVSREALVDSDASLPMGAVVAQLSTQTSTAMPEVSLPGASAAEFHDLHFSERNKIISFFYQEVFYGALANSLLNREEQTARYLDGLNFGPWMKALLLRIVAVAESIRPMLQAKDAVPYDAVYSALSDVERPPGRPFDDDYNFWHAARLAVIDISADLLALSSRYSQCGPVSREETESVFSSAMFNGDLWLRSVTMQRRSILSEEALRWVIDRCRSDLAEQVDTCSERAQRLSYLANLATLHDATEDARSLLTDCASHLIAYGNHKDPLLHLAVEETDAALNHGLVAEGLAWIKLLAPAIANVGEFTDGDETRHVPRQLGEVLAKHAPAIFVEYYLWLVQEEEYYDASDVFSSYVEHADLALPANRAVVATSVDEASLSKFRVRLDRGDPGAAACADLFRVVLVPDAEIREEASNETKDVTLSIDVTQYGPDSLSDLLDAASSHARQDIDRVVREWAVTWVDAGKGPQVLEELDLDHERRWRTGDYVLRYEIAFRVEGRANAFSRLVAGYTAASGWSPYYRLKDAKKFWQIVKSQYPDRWYEFLSGTMRSDQLVHKHRVSATGSHSRLMAFLLEIGELELATEVGNAVVGTAVGLVSPLPLSVPEWTANV